jgi:hypothetical protein
MSFLGGGDYPDPPKPIDPNSAENQAARLEAKRKTAEMLKKRKGAYGTIMTGPEGLQAAAPTQLKTILGQ